MSENLITCLLALRRHGYREEANLLSSEDLTLRVEMQHLKAELENEREKNTYRHCTCDDHGDAPCPVHQRENLLEAERDAALKREHAEEDARGKVEAKLEEAKALLKDAALIAELAFYDHHTAGTIPGAGYSHKAEHQAGRLWGWRKTEKFDAWKKRVEAGLS